MRLKDDLTKQIEGQQNEMRDLVIRWSSINSGSYNLPGINRMIDELKAAYAPLSDGMKEITLPPQIDLDSEGNQIERPVGPALHIWRRKEAPFKILFSGHMDTVFQVDSPFQSVREIDGNTLNGPGVSDLKGGLVVMLKTIEAIESSAYADRIGWEIVFNPDEEIGSMSSASLLAERAKECTYGLVFEPSLPDGTFISARKGSSNFSVIAKGKSAHVGREFHLGNNAVAAVGDLMARLHRYNQEDEEIVLNCARMDGGAAPNVVPDLAIGRFNMRFSTQEAYDRTKERIELAMSEVESKYGVKLQYFQQNFRAPKPFDEKTEKLFNHLRQCSEELGMEVRLKESGGVCDGNILSQAGLPNIDTLGVRGGKIHTDEEYILLDSLTERVKLATSLIIHLINEENGDKK